MGDGLARECHLQQDGGVRRRRRRLRANAIEDPLEQSGRIDRPRQPAAYVIETGACHDTIRSLADAERCEMRRFDAAVDPCEHERGDAVRNIDGERVRRRSGGERPCSVLNQRVTQHSIARACPAHVAESADQV